MGFQPGQGALRLARTLVVVVPSMALSAAAHAAAGGCVTALGVLLAGSVLATTTWTQLTRERSTGFLLCWVGLSQLLGHGLLELGCRGPAHSAADSSASMLTMHVTAALLVALLLSYGERRVWAFARVLSSLPGRLQQVARRLTAVPLRATPSDCWILILPVGPPSWQASPWCSPLPVRRGPPRLAPSLA